MTRIGAKLLSCILAVLLIWSALPVAIFAEDAPSQPPVETQTPTEIPALTDIPTELPTIEPASTPTEAEATEAPTSIPTAEPTLTLEPSLSPTEMPTVTPEVSATPQVTPVLEGFDLQFDGSSVSITRYTGSGEHTFVPAFVDGYPVTTIATGTFSDLDTLVSVEVSEGVLTVQSGTFSHCPTLKSIVLPASITDIAQDAIIDCPQVTVTAPDGSVAATFGTYFSQALLPSSVQLMAETADALPEYSLRDLLNVDIGSTHTRPHPTEDFSMYVLATLSPADGSPVTSTANLSDWLFSVEDSGGQPVDQSIVTVYFGNDGDQEQIRVNIGKSCKTGTYTTSLRGQYGSAYYLLTLTFEVLPAPALAFDDAITITNEFNHGIPSLLYIGTSTTDFNGSINIKDGSGLDSCEFERAYFENQSYIQVGFDPHNISLYPYAIGTGTLHIRVRGRFGYNFVEYEKTYTIVASDLDFERPTLTLNNEIFEHKLLVNEGASGVNVTFKLLYSIEGGEHTDDFRANVQLRAQNAYGRERLQSAGGDVYSFTEPGLYPVTLVASYLNVSIEYSFFVQVCGEGGVEPAATFESYFNMVKNENGDCTNLFFAPTLAVSHWVASFDLLNGAPFDKDNVGYEIAFLGNDVDSVPYTDGIACATVHLKQTDDTGLSYDITAEPNTAEGAGPALSRYQLKATVTREGKPDEVYTTEFAVNMVKLEGIENLPAKALNLTSSKIKLNYNNKHLYSLPLPGILLGGKRVPNESRINLYNVDRNDGLSLWNYLIDSSDNGTRKGIMHGDSVTVPFEWDNADTLKMLYSIDYCNLRWEGPFNVYVGVYENDASVLFDVGTQQNAIFCGSLADQYVWGGNFYINQVYHVTSYSGEVVSTPAGGTAALDVYDASDETFTDIGFSFAPSKAGTYRIRLVAFVDEDNDDATEPTRYEHTFELKVLATPANFPKAITLKNGNAMTVKVNEEFSLPEINESVAAYNSYGWSQGLWIWGDGALKESGGYDEHGPTADHRFWCASPGRYKVSRELTIGANYTLRDFITLTVTNEDNEVVVTDISASIDHWGWDDVYVVMPNGNPENDLLMFNAYNMQLGDDVTEKWTLNLSDDSTGKFSSYSFVDQSKSDGDTPSTARLVGYFPTKTGTVKFTVSYDAYEGTGEDAIHIYHGETSEFTFRIVDNFATGDFRLTGTPATYYTNSEGFVHIDAWDAVSDDTDLDSLSVHNNFYPINDDGVVQLTAVNDVGEDDWEHATGCDVRIDPTKKGTYLINQHSWVSLTDTDLWADMVFRVVVGNATGAPLKINENSIDLSTINLRGAEPNISEKYYWVDGAVGETLNWKLTRIKGNNIDLAIVNSDGHWGNSCQRVLNSAMDNNGNILHITALNGIGQSTFELSATLVTVDGKALTAKKTITVNVVDQDVDNFQAELTASKRVFETEVGKSVEIPQPTITWPKGTGNVISQRLWFWSDPNSLSAYTYDPTPEVRNLVLCPLAAGHYTINFEVIRGVTISDIVYTLIVNEPGETAPAAQPQMHVYNSTENDQEYYDTDDDGLIELTCALDGGVNAWSTAAIFSMWGMDQSQKEGLTFVLDEPEPSGVVEARISKRLGDCTMISARYTSAIGSPCTYTIHALIDGVDTGKRVKVTFLPPRVPKLIDELNKLTLSVGMNYQLDVDLLSTALGEPVTAFSCDFKGKTDTDKRFTVSKTGLIAVTANVGKAYVYAETGDPANLAMVEVTIVGAPATIMADKASFSFTDTAHSQQVTLTVKDATGKEIPAVITPISNNPAVCTLEFVSTDWYSYTYNILPEGFGETSVTFSTMGAKVTIPVKVTQQLTNVTLTAPKTITAGSSGTITPDFEPADASDKTLSWEFKVADGEDTTKFNNAWITMNNNVITVSKALDRVISINAIAKWKLEGTDKRSSTTITLLPLVSNISISPVGDWLTKQGTQYSCDITDFDAESPVILEAHITPDSLEHGHTPPVKWESNAIDIATVDKDGKVTLRKPGTVKISATTMDGSSASQSITLVVRKYVTDIEVVCATEAKVVAGSGATLAFTARYQPLDATLKAVTWPSSDPTLLSVNPVTGVATAVKGASILDTKTVTIKAKATDGSLAESSATVTIVPKATAVTITGIGSYDVTTAVLPVVLDAETSTEPLKLDGTVTPDDGYPLTWVSSNPSAASVSNDASGKAYLTLHKNAEKVTLTATARSNAAAKSAVTINIIHADKVKPTKVTIVGSSTLAAGASATYMATVEPATSQRTVTWSLCDSAGIIKPYAGLVNLSAGGVLAAKVNPTIALPADVYIKATTDGADSIASDPFLVTIYAKATAVSLTGPEDSLISGQQVHFIDISDSIAPLTLTAAVIPTEARQAVTFSTSDRKVFTVEASDTDPNKVIVTAVGMGTANVRATAQDGSGRFVDYPVTVGIVTQTLSIYAPAEEMPSGGKMALTVQRTPALVINPTVLWSSSDPKVATVSNTGLVTAKTVKTGTLVTIQATAVDRPGLSESFSIRVRPLASDVTLYDSVGNRLTAKSTLNLTLYDAELGKAKVSAIASPYNASDSSTGAMQNVTFSSANPSVATVDAITGAIAAVAAGTTKITATTNDGSRKSASVNVTVVCEPLSLSVTGPDFVAIGKSVPLTASVLPLGVTKQDIAWSILSDSTQASINNAGVLTVKAGTPALQVISVQAKLSKKPLISYVFDVRTKTPVTTVATNYGTGNVNLKMPLYQGSIQVCAVCAPATASQQLVFSSDNTKVATVDQDGNVSFLTVGKTKITIAATDGSNVKTVITLTITK